jgi:hypothetical protein
MAFTISPIFDTNNYWATLQSCINVSILINTDSIGGEDITDLIINGQAGGTGPGFTVGSLYIDGSPISLPYTVAYGAPVLLQFDLCSNPIGTSANSVSLDINSGAYVFNFITVTKESLTYYVDTNSIDFGDIVVGSTVISSIAFFIGDDGYIANVDYVIPSLAAPYSVDPAYPSTFTFGPGISSYQPANIIFSPTTVGTFSTTLNVTLSSAQGPGSSWTNPVFTIPISITGKGVSAPPVTGEFSKSLTISNSIGI